MFLTIFKCILSTLLENVTLAWLWYLIFSFTIFLILHSFRRGYFNMILLFYFQFLWNEGLYNTELSSFQKNYNWKKVSRYFQIRQECGNQIWYRIPYLAMTTWVPPCSVDQCHHDVVVSLLIPGAINWDWFPRGCF